MKTVEFKRNEGGLTSFPQKEGMYVAYVDSTIPLYTKRMLLIWIGGRWYLEGDHYPGRVHAWVGPLPSVRLP